MIDKASQLVAQSERWIQADGDTIRRRLSQPPKPVAVRTSVQPGIEDVLSLGHSYPISSWISGERSTPIVGETFQGSFRNAAVATSFM